MPESDMEDFYSARGTETQLLREDFEQKKEESSGSIDTMLSDVKVENNDSGIDASSSEEGAQTFKID